MLFILISIYSTLFNNSKAQTATSSPYSRYGIGELNNKGFGQNFAMGGTTIAMQNDTIAYFFINTGNPASYSTRLTIAELGLNYNRTRLQSTSAEKTINNVSLAYLSLAFPFKKWWGGSIGLVPYSSVGYKVSDHQEFANIGGVDFLYEGSGGINQAYFGTAVKPFYGIFKKRKKSLRDLSLGTNVSYLFGGFDNTRRSIFPSGYFFNTRTSTTSRISDIYLDYGVQYAYSIDSLKGRDLKENVKVMLGATFATQTDINARIDSLSVTYFNNASGFEIVKDTVESVQNAKGTITFPLSFGFGLGFKKGTKWLIAADYAMQNWSSYKVFNKSQGLKNSMRVSLGAQYVPNTKANGKGEYHKRMHYRMGVRYAQTALELKSTQLTEYAVSIGFGFPVGRNYLLQNFSMVNIGVEVGQRGTTTNGLIKEQFFKATIGFTINDRWFVKPKFD